MSDGAKEDWGTIDGRLQSELNALRLHVPLDWRDYDGSHEVNPVDSKANESAIDNFDRKRERDEERRADGRYEKYAHHDLLNLKSAAESCSANALDFLETFGKLTEFSTGVGEWAAPMQAKQHLQYADALATAITGYMNEWSAASGALFYIGRAVGLKSHLPPYLIDGQSCQTAHEAAYRLAEVVVYRYRHSEGGSDIERCSHLAAQLSELVPPSDPYARIQGEYHEASELTLSEEIELESLISDSQSETPVDKYPYPYGSDLHWLHGWGYRLGLMLENHEGRSEHDWMIFRPDEKADEAMLRLGIDFASPIDQLQDRLAKANSAYGVFVAKPDKANECALSECLDFLQISIMRVTEIIAERQGVAATRQPSRIRQRERGDNASTNDDPLRPIYEKIVGPIQRDIAWWRKCIIEYEENPLIPDDDAESTLPDAPLAPLPDRKMPFATKAAWLAAIHDECAKGVPLVNPWGESQLAGEGQAWTALVRVRIPELRKVWREYRVAVELMAEAVLAKFDEDHPAPATDPPQPISPWEIEAGGFKFQGGKFVELGGKPLAVLREFVEHPRRQTFGYKELREAWGDEATYTLDGTVKSNVSKLRKVLVRVAEQSGIACDDPIPHKNGSWSFEMPR